MEVPTAATIEKFRPSKDTFHRATRIFEQLGFEVLSRGPQSLTIIADAALFEQVFDTMLERVLKEAGRQEARAVTLYFKAMRPLTLPAVLEPHVETVVLPVPAELFP